MPLPGTLQSFKNFFKGPERPLPPPSTPPGMPRGSYALPPSRPFPSVNPTLADFNTLFADLPPVTGAEREYGLGKARIYNTTPLRADATVQENINHNNDLDREEQRLESEYSYEIKHKYDIRAGTIIQELMHRPGAEQLGVIGRNVLGVLMPSYYNMAVPVDGGKRRRHKTKKSKRKSRKTRRRKH